MLFTSIIDPYCHLFRFDDCHLYEKNQFIIPPNLGQASQVLFINFYNKCHQKIRNKLIFQSVINKISKKLYNDLMIIYTEKRNQIAAIFKKCNENY